MQAMRRTLPTRPRPTADATKLGLMDKVRGMGDNLDSRFLYEHRDRADDHIPRGKIYSPRSKEYFPEARRDQFISRNEQVRFFLANDEE